MVIHKKKEMKVKHMIMDDIKDHFIPHKFEKKKMLEIFDALVSLYESENINMKMIAKLTHMYRDYHIIHNYQLPNEGITYL